MKTAAISIFFSFFFVSSLSTAKIFRNSYISFEIPEIWKCVLESTEWLCRADKTQESKEALIILTAKEVGPTDQLTLYQQHLNNPLRGLRVQGAPSKVVYQAKSSKINDQVWIDGLHMGSEVGNYFTRYLATLKDKVAILVTLSAQKDQYTKYSQDFFKTVQSLRVIATKNLSSSPELGPLRPAGESLGTSIGSAIPDDLMEGNNDDAQAKGSSKKTLIYILIAALSGLGYFVYKKKNKNS